MGTWKTYKLGDVCFLADGEVRRGWKGQVFDVKSLRSHSKGKYATSGRFVHQNTYVILVDGENSGELFQIPEDGYMGSTFRQLSFSNEICSTYLRYFLSYQRLRFKKSKRGAAIPHLDRTLFANLSISLPPLEEQERIAGVLGAYDDLIAVNERQMALLEEAAHRLYRAYFATHADPDWEQKPLGEVATLDPSIPLSKSAKEPRFVAMEALSEHSMLVDVYHAERRKARGGSRFQNGDSLLARISPCLENGKTGFVMGLEPDEVAIGSTEFIVFREKVWGKHMLYCLLRTRKVRIHAKNSLRGADGRQRAQTTFLAEYQVPNPPPNVIADFEAQVSPYFEAIGVLARENVLLREGRDKLLPRLLREEA